MKAGLKSPIFAIAALLTLIYSSPLYATGKQPDVAQVDTFLGGAYEAVQNDDNSSAVKKFESAGDLARKIQDWQGLVDAGYGLAALNETKKAHQFFQEAFTVSRTVGSWQGLVAAGYALSSLPKEMNLIPQAQTSFSIAAQFAEEDRDWRGLVEAGKGFHVIENATRANATLDKALQIAGAQEDPQAVMTVAEAFEDIGNTGKAAQARSLANEISRAQGGDTRMVKTPPPGWSPTGESVRKTDEVPLEAQRLNRESVDKDISEKMEYIRQQKQLASEEKRERQRLAEAYLYYSGYYDYPGRYFGIDQFGLFGFGRHPLSRRHLRSWSSFHLSHFSRDGGFFIRIDRDRFHRHRRHRHRH